MAFIIETFFGIINFIANWFIEIITFALMVPWSFLVFIDLKGVKDRLQKTLHIFFTSSIVLWLTLKMSNGSTLLITGFLFSFIIRYMFYYFYKARPLGKRKIASVIFSILIILLPLFLFYTLSPVNLSEFEKTMEKCKEEKDFNSCLEKSINL